MIPVSRLLPLAPAVTLAAFACCAHAAVPCEQLTSVKLHDGTVTSAAVVEAGQFAPAAGGPPNAKQAFGKLPAFCRVQAHLHPTAQSDILAEVWLPVSGWNGKLVEGGNGGLAGSIAFNAFTEALPFGYAVAGTDTGHTGGQADFPLGQPEKVIDFGYRSTHETAVAAKEIIQAHYGTAAKEAYFDGCSTGGRQALGEAERYPEDFNGIIAGDPGIDTTHLTAAQTWVNIIAHNVASPFMPQEKYTMLHNAAIAACDALDGVKDGVIENPERCNFDPRTLVCRNGDGPDCLTAAQAEFVREVYTGPVSPSGKKVFPGLMPGSEAGWYGLAGPQPMGFAVGVYKYLVMQNPDWDYMTLDLDRDVAHADQVVGGIINNDNPDIKAFFARGGKLLGYHGWNDPGMSPYNSIDFYKAVAAKMGGEKAISNSYRLFMVPGMGHCQGGDGTSTFDNLTVLDHWVVDGKAPDSIPASRTRNGQVDRTRPLCPYPQQAVYKGYGSTDDAQNFACAVKK